MSAGTGSADRPLRVGVLSDTHGLLRPEALAFLAGCDHILHGGDVGCAEILDRLAAIAPLTAVRGNNDRELGNWQLRDAEQVRLGEVAVYLIHDLHELAVEPSAAGIRVVISGHSHKPSIEERNGILWFNPGSCGPRRFNLPVSIGELTVHVATAQARWVDLAQPARGARAGGAPAKGRGRP
jgi:putative phosphoesterase